MMDADDIHVGFEPEATHGANNGLKIARDLLEKIHAKYPEISYGDLWTLAGVCAIQELVNIFIFSHHSSLTDMFVFLL